MVAKKLGENLGCRIKLEYKYVEIQLLHVTDIVLLVPEMYGLYVVFHSSSWSKVEI
jgi:hypothetical protein